MTITAQLHDGRTLEFPDGTDPAVVQATVKKVLGAKADETKPTAQKPSNSSGGFAMGLGDPIHGGAQLLTKMLPDSVVNAGNRANNWLAEKTGLVAKLPEGGVDQQVRQREADYAKARAAAGEIGFDWKRLGGNVLNPVNLALGAAAPTAAAATLAGRMGVGAGLGAASSLTAPVTEGDFLQEKGKQVGVGALGGAVIPAAVAGIGRMISPKASTDASLALLKAEGVKPTIGQTLGGTFNAAEEKFSSLPLMGDMIKVARGRADRDLRVAVANRALEPINDKLPKGLDGREAVSYVHDALRNAYESLLPKMSAKADDAFVSEMNSLRSMVKTGSIDPNAAKTFNRIVQNDVLGKFRGQNALTGQTIKQIEGDLTERIARLGASQDADQRLVSDALKETRRALRELVERNNPQFSDELKSINRGYANFKRMQRAASYVGAEDGNFSAANLQSAVRALDRSKDKRGFSEGTALMQDLSDAAKARLGNKIPDSGTAGRAALGIGALSSGYISPYIPATLAGGAASYAPLMQSLLRGSVSSRPALAEPVARMLNQTSPMLAPAGGLFGINVLDE